MIDHVRTVLAGQFEASLAMLDQVCARVPSAYLRRVEPAWRDRSALGWVKSGWRPPG